MQVASPRHAQLLRCKPNHHAAARKRSARRGLLFVFTIGKDGDLGDPDGNWHEAYGVDTDGAVLVRPDGHVAWRSRTSASNPLKVLRRALDCLFGWMPAIA